MATKKPGQADNKVLTKQQCHHAARLQFAYMATVKPLRVREVFLDSLCRNIRFLKLHQDLEERLTATAIKAFGSRPADRAAYSLKAMDALDCLLPAMQREKTKQPKNKGKNEGKLDRKHATAII